MNPTDRGSREEEPEVVAGGSGPGDGRARGGVGRVGAAPGGSRTRCPDGGAGPKKEG